MGNLFSPGGGSTDQLLNIGTPVGLGYGAPEPSGVLGFFNRINDQLFGSRGAPNTPPTNPQNDVASGAPSSPSNFGGLMDGSALSRILAAIGGTPTDPLQSAGNTPLNAPVPGGSGV